MEYYYGMEYASRMMLTKAFNIGRCANYNVKWKNRHRLRRKRGPLGIKSFLKA